MYETLKIEVTGGVATVQLARPERRNAISRQMLRDLLDMCGPLGQRDDVRVVVLEGEGTAFCAGVDLDDFSSFLGEDDLNAHTEAAARASSMANLGRDAVAALGRLPQPLVAKVHGYAVGAGAVLMLAADFRVMADDSYVWIPEVDLGTPLVWGALPRLVVELGPARAKDFVTTCRRVSADEALAVGLASRVVPAAELDSKTMELAAGLAARSRFAVQATIAHVDAVVRIMAAGDTSYADRYLQVASWSDPEVRGLARDYLARFDLGE